MADTEESDTLKSERLKLRQSLKLKLIPMFCMVDMEDMVDIMVVLDTMVDTEESETIFAQHNNPKLSAH